MFDTIFLHAGLPKTGSSYLQDSMHALSQSGRLARVAYPCATPMLGTGNGSALAAEIIFTNPNPTTTEQLRAHVDNIFHGCHPAATDLLISSEDLCYADVEKFCRLKQMLLARARSVKLIIAVRPLREWSYSVYLQLVKAHALAADYDADWLQAHTNDFLYYFRNLDRFDVDTISFRYQRKDLLRRFLAVIGENEAVAAEVPDTVANRSLSAREVDVLRTINGVFSDDILCRQVSREFAREQPGTRGAQFPAHREADFRNFLANFTDKLEPLSGPAMTAVKRILLDDPDSTQESTTPRAKTTNADLLSCSEVEIALRAIRAILELRNDEASQYRRLLDYVSRLALSQDHFDPVHYLLMHQDVLRAGSDPRQHFEQHGRDEARMTTFVPTRSE